MSQTQIATAVGYATAFQTITVAMKRCFRPAATSRGVASAQRPWPKIVEENQTPRQILRFAHQRGKVRHFSKNKSAIQRREHVILMTRQNVTRPQLPDGFREALATVR